MIEDVEVFMEIRQDMRSVSGTVEAAPVAETPSSAPANASQSSLLKRPREHLLPSVVIMAAKRARGRRLPRIAALLQEYCASPHDDDSVHAHSLDKPGVGVSLRTELGHAGKLATWVPAGSLSLPVPSGWENGSPEPAPEDLLLTLIRQSHPLCGARVSKESRKALSWRSKGGTGAAITSLSPKPGHELSSMFASPLQQPDSFTEDLPSLGYADAVACGEDAQDYQCAAEEARQLQWSLEKPSRALGQHNPLADSCGEDASTQEAGAAAETPAEAARTTPAAQLSGAAGPAEPAGSAGASGRATSPSWASHAVCPVGSSGHAAPSPTHRDRRAAAASRVVSLWSPDVLGDAAALEREAFARAASRKAEGTRGRLVSFSGQELDRAQGGAFRLGRS